MIAASEDILMDLLRRAGRGDETALRELQQLTRRLLAYCIRRVVKDPWREEEVLQDVYTYIWQHTGGLHFCPVIRHWVRAKRHPCTVKISN